MVNFTHAPVLKNTIFDTPRKNLLVKWNKELGLVAARGRFPANVTPEYQLDLVNLIRVAAQRGGHYAR